MHTGADVIVVGGGTAGCVVAGRLAERGVRVTLLEAGPDYGPPGSGTWPADLLRVPRRFRSGTTGGTPGAEPAGSRWSSSARV